MPKNLRGRRLIGVIAALACALMFVLPVVVPSLVWGHARASAEPSAEPAKVVYVTSGLTWVDVSADTTPNLACFANRSGVAAMSVTSESVLPTKRQGLESLATGTRTPKLSASAARTPEGAARLPESVGGDSSLTVVDLGDVDVTGTAKERRESLAALDAQFAEQAGPCGRSHTGKDGTRAALASVGHINPAPDDVVDVEAERSYSNLAVPLQMQAYIDSGWGPAILTSPSTRQPGIVMNVDVAPTLAGQDSVGIGRAMAGSPVEPAESADAEPGGVAGALDGDPTGPSSEAVTLVRDLSVTTRLTEDALGIVMGCVGAVLITAGTLVATLRPTSAGRQRIRRVATHVLSLGLLAIPAGLTSRLLPLGPITHTGLPAPVVLFAYIAALTGIAGTLLVIAVRLLRPQAPLLIPVAAGLGTAALICLDSILGSHAQFTSVMGNQPLYAGRFYGITNHLTGIMLAGWILGLGALIHALPAFTSGRRAGLRRVALVGITGVIVGAIAIAPGMGADAGSALMYLPATLVGCFLVSGLRTRIWHIAAALGIGAAVFFGAGFLDYLRPSSERTHLGAFIAQILGDSSTGADSPTGITAFFSVFADRTVRMLEPLWIYPWFLVWPAVLLGLALAAYALRPSGGFATRVAYAWRLRAVGIGAAVIGAVTNDTGLVLLAAAFAAGAALSGAIIAQSKRPDPLPSVPHTTDRSGSSSGEPQAHGPRPSTG